MKLIKSTATTIAQHSLERVIVRDPLQYQHKLNSLISSGVTQLQIVADFDFTLTKFKHNSSKCDAIFSMFSKPDPQLPDQMIETLKRSYELFGPIQLSGSRSFQEKKLLIDQFYKAQLQTIIRHNLKISTILAMLDTCNVVFRHGFKQLMQLVNLHSVPFHVLSGGITQMIESLIDSVQDSSHVRVLSNDMTFNNKIVTGFSKPTIHSYNKYRRFEGKSAGRRNCLLLGDQRTDFYMADRGGFENIMSFYMAKSKSNLDYQLALQKFDVVIQEDGSLLPVVDMIRSIAN